MSLENNLTRYPWYRFFRDCNFWGPAFFLYFTSVLTLEQALWLEAIYYVSAAALEIPSGYISDRWGRRYTLVFSSACLALAFFLFFWGQDFASFALAQLFLAAGYASASGTDTALHFESLKELKKAQEYTIREAQALKFSFRAGALGALGGGLLAMGNLKWIYGASCLSALVSMAIALNFKEPSRETNAHPPAMVPQIKGLMAKALSPDFRFFTYYTVGMILLLHFPYEFYQPYVDRVMDSMGAHTTATPMITGLHLAATALVGSYCTRFAKTISHGCEIRRILILSTLFQVLLITLMAWVTHPLIVILLAGRTLARAVTTPLVNAQVSPRLQQTERSTYLSLQSLLGRLGYGLSLIFLPLGSRLFSDGLRGSLFWASLTGLALIFTLVKTPSPATAQCCQHPGQCPPDTV